MAGCSSVRFRQCHGSADRYREGGGVQLRGSKRQRPFGGRLESRGFIGKARVGLELTSNECAAN